MALVAPKPELRNPLPAGKYFIVLNPEHVQDFRDWVAIYTPRKIVSVLADHEAPSFFGGADHQVTFEVHQPNLAFWWHLVFGPPQNVSEAPRVVAPSVDRAQTALERPIEAASSAAAAAASAITSVGPLVTVGLLLLLYLELTKGRRHGLF
jgi:hypothetical protein